MSIVILGLIIIMLIMSLFVKSLVFSFGTMVALGFGLREAITLSATDSAGVWYMAIFALLEMFMILFILRGVKHI